MVDDSKYALSLTYGPKEAQLLLDIDQLSKRKILPKSRNEIIRRGLYACKSLSEVNEQPLISLLSKILHSDKKSLNLKTLQYARDLAYVIFSIITSKDGISKAESFETIPLSLDTYVKVFTKENTDLNKIKNELHESLEKLAISVDTVFLQDKKNLQYKNFLSMHDMITSKRKKLIAQRMLRDSFEEYRNQLNDSDETSDSRLSTGKDKPRVVVIDDDKETVRVLSEYLTIKGLDVVAVGYNGKQAVELFKIHKPDIILLDLMMPDYDGFYGLQNIKKINLNAKVVIVTSDLTSAAKRKLVKLDASALIYKPYEIESLISTINIVNKNTKSLKILPEHKLSKKLIEMMNAENVIMWRK